jgi:soluble cytochrome b562
MIRKLLIIVSLLFLPVINAQDSELATVMKEMALSYKQARDAQTIDELSVYLNEIESALNRSIAIGFKQKETESIEGIKRVLTQVNAIQKTQDINLAKKQLVEIDSIRKQYHKLHEPSIWQLLFGD